MRLRELSLDMLWRLLFPFFFMVAPRIIPRLGRVAYVVWNLTFNRRVPLLLRLLIPLSLLYFIFPFSRLHFVGMAGYLIVLSLAAYLLINLSPREVVESYAPWRARSREARESNERDSSRVVDSSYRMVDEEEPTEN